MRLKSLYALQNELKDVQVMLSDPHWHALFVQVHAGIHAFIYLTDPMPRPVYPLQQLQVYDATSSLCVSSSVLYVYMISHDIINGP